MHPQLTRCPVCGGELAVTRLRCAGCDTTIEGRFETGPFAALSAEQLAFVETFVRCEGKFTRMQGEMSLSYPTLRARLYEIIRALGYEPGAEEPAGMPEEERRQILADVNAGRITASEAVRLLKGGEG
jgi:hypothetical protein